MENKSSVQNIFNCLVCSDNGRNSVSNSFISMFDQCKIHPAILRLGMRMKERRIVGTNIRSKCLLIAIGQMLEDYYCPPYKSIEKHLKTVLDTHISYITSQRQHNIAMGNVIKWLKRQVCNINPSLPPSEIINQLISCIKTYIYQRIVNACERISFLISNKYIIDGDVIVTYSNSSSVIKSLFKAAGMNKSFQLIVVDSKNNIDSSSQNITRELSLKGIKTTYTLLNCLAYHLRYTTKVIIGSCAIFSNGYVMNRSGSSLVAMLAKIHRIPVMIVSESYKLCDKNYFEHSTIFNEVVEQKIPDSQPCPSDISNGNFPMSQTVAYIPYYDVIPPRFIDAIVTEDGIFSAESFSMQNKLTN
ncbi:putative guaning nucleotide exchange factor eIF-2B [Cryptosporidium canis]|uniref:Translation initiation factor eIF2B subunit delta n=1 Tax=Cryptosporidium canis TaxID=195482 RepID=A0A9D5DGN9_9CRYT|nr:putative guaning nucleotide exchange factor eIF-2B [Cryptosporidium canis]